MSQAWRGYRHGDSTHRVLYPPVRAPNLYNDPILHLLRWPAADETTHAPLLLLLLINPDTHKVFLRTWPSRIDSFVTALHTSRP